MRHILGNKVLQYDVDDRGVIVDEREIDRDDMSKPVDVYAENFNDWTKYPVNADVAITSTTFTITRFVAENDVVKCYIPSKTKKIPRNESGSERYS